MAVSNALPAPGVPGYILPEQPANRLDADSGSALAPRACSRAPRASAPRSARAEPAHTWRDGPRDSVRRTMASTARDLWPDLPEPIERALSAMRDHDWAALAEVVHPDVVWHLMGSPGFSMRGRDSYLWRVRLGGMGCRRPGTVLRAQETFNGRHILELEDAAGARVLDIIRLEHDLIREEWEMVLEGPRQQSIADAAR